VWENCRILASFEFKLRTPLDDGKCVFGVTFDGDVDCGCRDGRLVMVVADGGVCRRRLKVDSARTSATLRQTEGQ